MRADQYLDPAIETIGAVELRALQDYKLAKQLDYVFSQSPFYQTKAVDSGIRREHLRSLADLSRFPFTTKDELRQSQMESPPLGRHAVADMKSVIRIHSSTGTSGHPSLVGITRHDAEVWTRITARSFYTQGIRPADIVIHAASLTLFVGGLPSKDAIEFIGATFVPVGTGASERLVEIAKLLDATALHCTPSYAMYLADYVRREAGMEPRALGLERIVCGGEPGVGNPAVRARITDEWGVQVTEGLGNADMAPIIFAECPDQSGMHFNGPDYIFAEIVDPESGEVLPVEAGVSGELVFTSLERECVPLLRFRTRDRVTIMGTSCACGRTSFKLRCVGRTDDMLIVLGVNVFPSAVKDVVASFYPKTTGEIQILVDQPGPGVKPPLKVVAEFGNGPIDIAALKRQLEAKIKSVLSVQADVELVASGTIPKFKMKGQLVRKLYQE